MEVPRLPLRTAAASVLVPELVDPVRRRPARHRYEEPPRAWLPVRTPQVPAGYAPVAPVTGGLVDVYG